MATTIEKATALHRVGSFGTPIHHGERGDEVTEIWFCGALTERNGYAQDRCAHRSRREAMACGLRVAQGEG